ncbi:MAG: cupin domain-containing protein [Terracidiphilus sp.]
MEDQPLKVVSTAACLRQIHDFYRPMTIGHVNGVAIKLVRLRGEFVWHRHEDEDEMFLVLAGTLVMQLRSGDLRLESGEMVVVPRGVEHCPLALDEVHLMLVEPEEIRRTGNATEIPARLRMD